MKVTPTDFIKNHGTLADKATVEPVTITGNSRDRRVVRLEDFTDAEMAAIAGTDASTGFEHLDEELKDWKR